MPPKGDRLVPHDAKTCVTYSRVSSREQEREGFSIQAQQRLLREYADRKGLTIVQEFVDVETAKATGRKQFGEMLAHLKRAKQPCAVLVEKTDRLHRNLADWAKIEGLNALGVDIHFVKENVVIGQDSTSNERFMYSIKASMAKHYIDNLSEEARKGMREKAEQGIWPSAAPYGYRNVVGANGKNTIEPDPVAAPIVRQLFEWYSDGERSLKDLAALARAAGFAISKATASINVSKIQQVLRRRIYTGEFEWKGAVYKGQYEPVIGLELYEAVQARLDGRNAKRHRRSKHDFAYARLMACERCGAAVVGEIKKGKYVYYHCTEHRGTCNDRYTREADLDDQFGIVLESLRFDDEVIGWIRSALIESHMDASRHHEEAIARLETEHRKLQHRIDAIYIDKLDGVVTPEFYDQKRTEWRAEQERCQRSIASHRYANDAYMQDGVRLLELASSAGRLFRKQSGAEKRRLLGFLVSNCTLADGKVIVTLKQPFDMIAEAAAEARATKPAAGSKTRQRTDWLGN